MKKTSTSVPVSAASRLIAGAALLVSLSCLASPAHAQTTPTIRFQPMDSMFSACGLNQRCATVDVYIDDVPAIGLKGFFLTVQFPSDKLTLIPPFTSVAVLDPNLQATWQAFGAINGTPSSPSDGVLVWSLHSSIPAGMTAGPSGTVRVGQLRFGTALGVQQATGTLTWGTSCIETIQPNNCDTGAPTLLDGTFTIGTPVSDLVMDCNTIWPRAPNEFADGDRLVLECTVTNNGTGSTGASTQAAVFFSLDGVVDNNDRLIDESGSGSIPNLLAGGTANLTLDSGPFANTPQPGAYQLCHKVDVVSGSPAQGEIFETNEANNTVCEPVTILVPTRDLTITNLGAVAVGAGTPAFHAGQLLEVTYRVNNLGIAVAREHRNVVYLSPDAVRDPSEIICELSELSSPGIAGGDSVTRTYGSDPNPTASQLCAIDFTTVPGTYFLGVEADANRAVTETDEANNTSTISIQVLGPVPPELRAADPNRPASDQKTEIVGPSSWPAAFVAISPFDLASYAFTVIWAPADYVEITNSSDVQFTGFLTQGSRTESCSPPIIDNTAGTLSVSCTSTGSGTGSTQEGASVLFNAAFKPLYPGLGTFTFSGVSATDSAGNSIPISVSTMSRFEVSGPAIVDLLSPVAPAEAFPGTVFSADFDLCNVGFSPTGNNVPTSIRLSEDPNIEKTDAMVCRVIRNDPIDPDECVTDTLGTCLITTDLRPGNYTAAFELNADPNLVDPGSREEVALPLPARILALRQRGDGRTLEATAAPSGVGGTVGPLLAFDKKFKARSIAVLKTETRNFNLLAGYVKPKDSRQKVQVYRLPKSPGEELEPGLSSLRLIRDTTAVLGGADVDGNDEDELIVLRKDTDGQRLSFRSVNYAKRRPEVGVPIAVTDPFTETVVGATGIQFDPDVEEEIVVVTESGGVQTLTVYDVAVTDPTVGPSTLVELASYPAFGSDADHVESICVIDHGLDGEEEIVTLNEASDGTQSLRVYEAPAAIGVTPTPAPIADDPAFGGTAQKKQVLGIACSR